MVKWLFSRAWEWTPCDIYFRITGRMAWSWLCDLEDWVAMMFPDSWYDQNDSCEEQDLNWKQVIC